MTDYPPTRWQDIIAYKDDEVIAGYREYRPGEPEPGANRDAGYRWGWANRRHDSTGIDDGFSGLRRAAIVQIPGLFETVH